MTSLRKMPVAAALAGVTALVLAACSPGSSNSNTQTSPAGNASTGIDPNKNVTITISDGWGTTGNGAAFAQVIKNFETKYPNVTVNRQTTDYTTYGQQVLLKGLSPNPPDVMMLETTG